MSDQHRLGGFVAAKVNLLSLRFIPHARITTQHVDSIGRQTWLLHACGRNTRRERLWLLSNFDLGIPLDAREVQTSLDFSDRLLELLEGKAMGEDALRVLDD